jgi:hypothetical protein
MPVHPIRQKHGNPKTEDTQAFLDSLSPVNDGAADVNARVVWNDHTKKTKASGCHIFAFHDETAKGNGYTHRWLNSRYVPMNSHDLHRNLSTWDAAEVKTWRRGRTKQRPQTLNALYRFVSRNGGTIIAEAKAREFRFKWIAQQLVNDAARWNQPLWFKALGNMMFFDQKAIAFTSATVTVKGVEHHAWMAWIGGTKMRGRAVRVAAARQDMANLPPSVTKYMRVW